MAGHRILILSYSEGEKIIYTVTIILYFQSKEKNSNSLQKEVVTIS